MRTPCDNGHEIGEKMQGALICADPIHLRADRDTAKLVPAAILSLTEAEVDALLLDINTFLAADNLQLWRSDTCHWFMQGQDGSELLSYPPEFLAQRNASAFLPEGQTSAYWKRLMTELQMLLHAHPVNAERERRGLMPVNSLWFWGGARLDENTHEHSLSEGAAPCIYADEAFAVALAAHLGLECRPLADVDTSGAESDVLIVDRRLEQAMLARDEAGVEMARQRFGEQWIAGWQERVQNGEHLTLNILDEDGMCGRLDAQVLSKIAQAKAADARAQRSALAQAVSRLGAGALGLWQRLRGPR